MSPLLAQVLTEVDQLDPQEQLKVIAHLIESWQQKSNLLSKSSFSRKNLFGCLQGQIVMAEDFDAPLNDFAEYM
jgi:Protein of unknown function (DUF2281)